MKFDFYMLFFMVGVGLMMKKMKPKNFVAITIFVFCWMMLLWKKY